MTIWRMRIACWILKATNTHSEYEIPIAFPLQQWLHERAPISRHRYIACLVPKLIGNVLVMCVSVNKQLLGFQNYFCLLSQRCYGRSQNKAFSLQIPPRTTCHPRATG
jgi:hypothetical protein